MTANAELKPCPFACDGSEPQRNSNKWGHFIECDCGARGPYGESPSEAFKHWNTRAAQPAEAPAGGIETHLIGFANRLNQIADNQTPSHFNELRVIASRLFALSAPPARQTGREVLWVGWHPEKGYAPQTAGHDQQHAASLLMCTGIAGEHGWSVQPLYAAASKEPDDGEDHLGETGTPMSGVVKP